MDKNLGNMPNGSLTDTSSVSLALQGPVNQLRYVVAATAILRYIAYPFVETAFIIAKRPSVASYTVRRCPGGVPKRNANRQRL